MSTKINYSEATGYKQIRNYKLFEPPIGKGATGIVFKAWDNKRNQYVSMSVFSSHYVSGYLLLVTGHSSFVIGYLSFGV